MLRFTKRHTVSLAKGLQQDRFLPCCQQKQLKPLLYQQCQCHFTDKNIVQTEEEWQNLHSCKLQGERSQEVPLWWLKILSIFLYFSVQNPQSTGSLGVMHKIVQFLHYSDTISFGLLTHCQALRERICPGKGCVHTTVVSFMTIHRTGRWMSPVKTQ